MKNTKKVIFSLLAGAAIVSASPAFADSYRYERERGYEHGRHFERSRDFDRHAFRDHHEYRGYAHRPVIVERPYYAHRPVIVERPYYVQRQVIVEQPYYAQPAQNLGLGAIIGAALGGIFDNQQ